MNHFDRLIAAQCPNGVHYKLLGDIGKFTRGNGLQKSDLADSGVGAIHYGQIHTHYEIYAAETKSFVRESLARKLRKARPGNLVISTTSEDDEGVAKAVAWIGNAEVAVSGDAYIFHHSLNPKYVSYFFQSQHFQEQKKSRITGTKVRRISGESLAKMRIPVPPLELQQEIVSILDRFSSLETELERELEARQAQYRFYREALLSSAANAGSDSQRVTTLGEVASIVRGASPRPIQNFITEGDEGMPWIKIGDVAAGGKYLTKTAENVTLAGAAKSRRIKPGDFLLSNSMSFGRPYISQIEGCIHDGWLAISDFGASFLPDFLYHLLSSAPVQAEFARRAGSGTVKNLNAEIVKSITVRVPPINEQQRIVAILDRFDALLNDPTCGLPAEISARRKQYAYYRDKLLTFKEAA